MKFESGALQIARSLGVGTREERDRVRAALDEFFHRQGYTAEMGSFRQGTLLLLAAPAEHALLRYDLGALRQHLDRRGLSNLVREVKVRAKPFATPQNA